jgi:hypothetical protein
MQIAGVLLFVHGVRQPFLVAGNKVQQVTEGPPEDPETRVRHGLTYLGHRVPQIVIDNSSYAFLFGNAPLRETSSVSLGTRLDDLATAIAVPLRSMAAPPPPAMPGAVAGSGAIQQAPAAPAAGASYGTGTNYGQASYGGASHGGVAAPGADPFAPSSTAVASTAEGGGTVFGGDTVFGGGADPGSVTVSGTSYKGLWTDSQIGSLVYFDGENLVCRAASDSDEDDPLWSPDSVARLGQSLHRGEDPQTVLRGQGEVLPLSSLRSLRRLKGEKVLKIEHLPSADMGGYSATHVLTVPYSVPSQGDALYRTCARCLRDGWKSGTRVENLSQDSTDYYSFLWGVLGLTAVLFVFSLFASGREDNEYRRSYSRRGRQAQALFWIASKIGPKYVLMVGGAVAAITLLMIRARSAHKEEIEELLPKPAAPATPPAVSPDPHVAQPGVGAGQGARPPPPAPPA